MSKIKDALYTARWALNEAIEKDNYKLLPTAVDAIADAQALLAESPSVNTTPTVLAPKPSWKPTVVAVKGVKFKTLGKFKNGGTPHGAIVHFTVSGRTSKNAESVVRYLAKEGLGCPVIDEDGIMYVAEGYNWETDATQHAGSSRWNGMAGLNSYFIGFEFCNWGTDGKKRGATDLRTITKNTENMYKGTYQKYTPAQEQFLHKVCEYLQNKYPTFKIENVAGHDEVRTAAGMPGDKKDPGGSLSMSMPDLRKFL